MRLIDVAAEANETINVYDRNIVIRIIPEGIIIDFWDDDSDGDPHATVGMTYDEWRDFADR